MGIGSLVLSNSVQYAQERLQRRMITICASNGLYRNRNDIPGTCSSERVASMGVAVNCAVGIAKMVRPASWPKVGRERVTRLTPESSRRNSYPPSFVPETGA